MFAQVVSRTGRALTDALARIAGLPVRPGRAAGAGLLAVMLAAGWAWSPTLAGEGPPSVTGVSPGVGSTLGGTAVTIAGSGFSGATSVMFGGVPMDPITVVNDFTITGATPPHAAGNVRVEVTTPGGSGGLDNAFAYVADAVANVYPPVIQGYAGGVAVDEAGNKYVTGYFYGAKDFNPGVGCDPKGSAGGYDVFVTRFNADGSYGWTQTFGGSSDDYAYGVAVSGGTVYVTGYF